MGLLHTRFHDIVEAERVIAGEVHTSIVGVIRIVTETAGGAAWLGLNEESHLEPET